MGSYGADAEVEKYLGCREGTGDYEGLKIHADVGAFKVFDKDIFCEKRKKFREPLNNFGTSCAIANRNTVFSKKESDCREEEGRLEEFRRKAIPIG